MHPGWVKPTPKAPDDRHGIRPALPRYEEAGKPPVPEQKRSGRVTIVPIDGNIKTTVIDLVNDE